MPEWLRYVSEVAVTGLLPLLVWNARVLAQIQRDNAQMRQTLYGVNGDNGIRSEVRSLRTDVSDHETRLQLHDGRLHELEGAK